MRVFVIYVKCIHPPISLFFVLILSIFGSTQVRAQTIQGPAVTCASLGLQAISGGHLDRYFTSSGGVGGLGCWVRQHPNGKDMVIAPHSWDRTPNPGKAGLVNGAFEAVTLTRAAVASAIGGSQTFPLMIMLNDIHSGAQAYWPIQNRCWIESGPTGGHGTWRDQASDKFRQMIAHEIGHCFIMENVTNYKPETYAMRNAQWWDESGADYISTLAYPSLNGEYLSSSTFDLDAEPFTQPYSGFLLLESLVKSGANLWVILNSLHKTSDIGELMALFKMEGWDRVHHKFAVDHFQRKVPDPGCVGTPCFYPRESSVSILHRASLSAAAGSIALPALAWARLNVIEITIPKGQDVILKSINSPSAELLGSVIRGSGQPIILWSRDTLVAGDCDNETTITLAFSHYEKALLSDATIPYELKERCCIDAVLQSAGNGQCGAQAHSIDRCLLGTWAYDAFRSNDADLDRANLTATGGTIREFRYEHAANITFTSSGFCSSSQSLKISRVVDGGGQLSSMSSNQTANSVGFWRAASGAAQFCPAQTKYRCDRSTSLDFFPYSDGSYIQMNTNERCVDDDVTTSDSWQAYGPAGNRLQPSTADGAMAAQLQVFYMGDYSQQRTDKVPIPSDYFGASSMPAFAYTCSETELVIPVLGSPDYRRVYRRLTPIQN